MVRQHPESAAPCLRFGNSHLGADTLRFLARHAFQPGFHVSSLWVENRIGPRFSVNSELKRFSPRDPGMPLDGIGQYVYPGRVSTPKLD